MTPNGGSVAAWIRAGPQRKAAVACAIEQHGSTGQPILDLLRAQCVHYPWWKVRSVSR